MPGTGAFGDLYPGGFGPEASGYEKAGAGTSAFVGSGSDATTSSEVGTGTSAFLASSAGAGEHSKVGAGISAFAGGGDAQGDEGRAGTATSDFAASGFVARTHAKAGTGVLERVAIGDDRLTFDKRNWRSKFPQQPFDGTRSNSAFGTTEKSVGRFGIAKSIFSGQGRQGDVVRGAASMAHSASGAITEKVLNKANISGYYYQSSPPGIDFSTAYFGAGATGADMTWVETGFTVRGLAATADSRITYVEAGVAISERAAGGVPGKAGTARAPFVGSGADATEWTKAGTAIAPLVGRGEAQPGGVATMVLSGGGTLKSLYANDNFAARELIDAPTGDVEKDAGARSWILRGATGRATTQTGEHLVFTFSFNYTKTLWWELQVPFPCIVELDVAIRNPGPNQQFILPTGFACRGTAVNATVPYESVTSHFGEVSGRGFDGRLFSNTDLSGLFPDQFAGSVGNPIVAQVDPTTPLIIQVGKPTNVTSEFEYDLTVRRLDPPDNDGPDSAIELDLAGGSLPFDLRGATGDRRWNWDQLESVMYFPNSYKLGGDIFYSIRPTEDGVFRFTSLIPGSLQSYYQAFLFEGADIATWTPMVVNPSESRGYVYASLAAGVTYTEVPLEGGKVYTLALCTLRNVFFWEFGQIYSNAQPVPRVTGTLTWEYIATPPSNDDLVNREVLSGALPIVTTVADARGTTQEVGEPDDVWFHDGRGVWYEYTPSTSGWYSFNPATYLTNYVTRWDFYRTPTSPPLFSEMELSQSQILFSPLFLRAGDTYYARLSPDGQGSLDYLDLTLDLAVANVAPNDDFADRISISGDAGDVVVEVTGSTSEFGEPVVYYWEGNQMPSVWYEWTPPYTGDYQIRTSGVYPLVGIYTGSSLDALTPLARYETYDYLDMRIHAQAGVPHQIQICDYPGFVADDPLLLTWRPAPMPIPTNVGRATAQPLATDTVVVTHNGGVPPVGPDPLPDTTQFIGRYFLVPNSTRTGRAVWYQIDPLFEGDFVFELASTNWDAGAMVLRDVNGTLQYALDANDDEVVTDFSYGDGYSLQLEARLKPDETYYLVVFSFANPNDSADWSAEVDQLFADDMFAQGEFSVSYTGSPLNDSYLTPAGSSSTDLDEQRASNLSWFDSYTYGGSEEYGPLISTSSGTCRLASNIGATADLGEPAPYPGWPATNSVWFVALIGGGGDYEFWIEPAGDQPIVDPMLAIYYYRFSDHSFSGLLTQGVLAHSDNFDGLYPYARVNGLDSDTYLAIQVDGRDQGTFEIKWRRIPVDPPPVNDDFADAIEVTLETPISGTTVGATVECGETPVAGWFEGPFGSVWYVYHPAVAGTAFLTVTAADHPDNAYIFADVFQGETIETLVNLTPGDTYNNGGNAQSFGFPVSFQAGIPVYIRFSTEYDGQYGTTPMQGSTFDFALDVGSTTPPANDDPGGATTVTGGTTVGNNDGAGYMSGEPDPVFGGQLADNDPSGGTTWHKYVSPAPGFVAVYATTTGPTAYWPAIGMWAGETPQTSKYVMAYANDPSRYPYRLGDTYPPPPNGAAPGALPCYFEVREGETYWIQVVRHGDQPWGDYTLHIDEYLEYNDWALGTDGFTSTTNSPVVSGDTMTCTGNQAISDVQSVLPQYGTIDLGADTPKWGRVVSIYFEVRMLAGQMLHREQWYGGDDWSFDNIASDDHVNLTMSRLGLVRARDTDGVQRMVATLAPTKNGENLIQASTSSSSVTSDVSLGVGRNQHDDGWIGVELVVSAFNFQYNDGSHTASGVDGSPYYPRWSVTMLVNGKPMGGDVGYSGKQLRYLDFGMFRHPSLYGPGNVGYTDQAYIENNEAWTYEMRRLRVTNKPREPYSNTFSGSLGVHEFDGFAGGAPWYFDASFSGSGSAFGGRHWAMKGGSILGITPIAPTDPVDAPDKPGWKALHSVSSDLKSINYGLAGFYTRWYGFNVRFESFPATAPGIHLASYHGGQHSLLGYLFVNQLGELRLTPYLYPDYCVAHLQAGDWHWIENHIDGEVPWEVKCTVYIDGVSFGTYLSGFTWSMWGSFGTHATVRDVPTSIGGGAQAGSSFGALNTLTFGPYTGSGPVDYYMTNTVGGYGNPGASVGPLETKQLAAVQTELVHGIPKVPDEYMDIHKGTPYARLYGWSWSSSNAGPIVSNGANVPLNVVSPRFFEPTFDLRPTAARIESSSGGGGSWADLNTGRTRIADDNPISATASTQTLELSRFGNSVPVDDTVVGIEVRVRRRAIGSVSDGTVQLRKAGSPVGSNAAGGAWSTDWEYVTYGGPTDLWGTTWSPQEVNSLTFGVGIAASGSGTAEIDQVVVRVYFLDEGRPDNIGRGSYLPPGGLYNLGADDAVVRLAVSGVDYGTSWPSSGWEPGGDAGAGNGYIWNSVYPLWLWQARGDLVPYFSGNPATATDIRIVRNPLTYPRYAYSDDDGATWTWIEPGDDQSASRIGSSAGSGTTAGVFLDNAAALDRFQCAPGGWSSGLDEDRPTSSPAYRHAYHYLAYEGEDTVDPTVVAANLRVRWRPYQGAPRVAQAGVSEFRAYIALPDGSVRKVSSFSGPGTQVAPNTNSFVPAVARSTVPHAPDGSGWTPQTFNALELRLGFNNRADTTAFSMRNNTDKGAALIAADWEILVPAPADVPPSPCAQDIDLSMMRMIPGAGDPNQAGITEGTDLSDVRFSPGAEQHDTPGTGTDLADVLYFPGAPVPEGG